MCSDSELLHHPSFRCDACMRSPQSFYEMFLFITMQTICFFFPKALGCLLFSSFCLSDSSVSHKSECVSPCPSVSCLVHCLGDFQLTLFLEKQKKIGWQMNLVCFIHPLPLAAWLHLPFHKHILQNVQHWSPSWSSMGICLLRSASAELAGRGKSPASSRGRGSPNQPYSDLSHIIQSSSP